MILFDANVWIYALDPGLGEHERALEAVGRATALDEILMPSIVELEVVHYTHRRFPDEADQALASWFAQPRVIRLLGAHDVRAASRLLQICRKHGIGARDATILMHASQDRALLVTNDRPLLKAAEDRGISFWNPIADDDSVLDTWTPRPQKVIRERGHAPGRRG